MISKLLLLAVLLLIACFIAAFLVDRLRQNVQQLAALKNDLARKDVELRRRVQALEEARRAQEMGVPMSPEDLRKDSKES
jgi:outer membrane murein-binding lipoprotein Lpp